MASILPIELGALVATLLLAVIATGALIYVLSRGGSIGVESHWGGLGGQVSGWRISNGFAWAVAVATGWLMSFGIVLNSANRQHDLLAAKVSAVQTAAPDAGAPNAASAPNAPAAQAQARTAAEGASHESGHEAPPREH
jgi:hypothetical protein